MAWRTNHNADNRIFKDAKKINIRCRVMTPMLGTTSANSNIYRDYIASKSPDASSIVDQLADGDTTPDDILESRMTIFPTAKFLKTADAPPKYYDIQEGIPNRVTGEEVILPYMSEHQWKGGFKEYFAMMAKTKGEKGPKLKASTIKAYKKIVDGNWFVFPRKIPLMIPDTYINEYGEEVSSFDSNGNLLKFERPLRANTPQGERVSLTVSEMVPPGTEFWFTVVLLNPDHEEILYEALDYKTEQGMLQWRNGGMGRLAWTKADENGEPIDD